jgi:hypothetical protein
MVSAETEHKRSPPPATQRSDSALNAAVSLPTGDNSAQGVAASCAALTEPPAEDAAEEEARKEGEEEEAREGGGVA